MENLLEELYRQDLHVPTFHVRRVVVPEVSCQIVGVTQSGKSTLLKHALLQRKKSSYLYINCNDLRIEPDALSEVLPDFCKANEIDTVALDNYRGRIALPPVKQLIITTEKPYDLDLLQVPILPLDFEEFLAFESKVDDSTLTHFLQTGGFPAMHRIASEDRARYIQKSLQLHLSEMELDIMMLVARLATHRLSAYSLYERLKQERKISKDMLYKNMAELMEKGYLHGIDKFTHKKAAKKVYLCDIAIKQAFTTQKHFGRLFETLVYLELHKHHHHVYYDEGVDFYLPHEQRVVLCMPFSNKDMLFKKIEGIEKFIISFGVTRVEVITVSSEATLNHPAVEVEMLPFANWALSEAE